MSSPARPTAARQSTTIGMLLGQVWPTSRTACIAGHDVLQGTRPALRRMGAIFETPPFYDLPQRMAKSGILPPTPRRHPKRLQEVLDWVGLSGREHNGSAPTPTACGRAWPWRRRCCPIGSGVILDEPTNGLDPEGIHEMRATIHLHSELGLTPLLSLPSPREVEQLIAHRGEPGTKGGADGLHVGRHRPQRPGIRLITPDPVAALAALPDMRAGRGNPPRRSSSSCGRCPSFLQLVCRLVALGIPVDAIAPEEPRRGVLSGPDEDRGGTTRVRTTRPPAPPHPDRWISTRIPCSRSTPRTWKLFGKKRTYLGFGMFLLAQAVILLVFRFSGRPGAWDERCQNNGYDVASFFPR